MGKPTICVAMVTYNHEDYISSAIEGFLMQQTNFEARLIIGEDRSTDRTREICEKYQAMHPDRITLLPLAKKLGINANVVRVLDSCDSEYIAICDGDDLWTEPDKLQKQVDFLEANKQYSFTFHRSYIAKPILIEGIRPSKYKEVISFLDILYKRDCPTMSLVFRKKSIDGYKRLVDYFATIDFLLVVMLAKRGLGYVFFETMGAYRLHRGGVYSSLSSIDKLSVGITNRKAILSHIDLSMDEKIVCRVMIFFRVFKRFLLKLT